MPKIRVQVLLCPNCQYLEKPAQPTWPRPAHVCVELTGKRGDTTSLVTNDKGVIGPTDLEAGRYRVQLAGYDFEGHLDVPADRPRATRPRTHEVRLAPSGEGWLVLLRLMGPAEPVSGAPVQITGAGASTPVSSAEDGFVYATYQAGDDNLPQLQFGSTKDGLLIPSYPSVSYIPPAQPSSVVTVQTFSYSIPIQIMVQPTVLLPTGPVPLVGTNVTVQYLGTPGMPGVPEAKQLHPGDVTVPFDYTSPGLYNVSATPPATVPTTAQTPFSNFPIENTSTQSPPQQPYFAQGAGPWTWAPQFEIVPPIEVKVAVATPQNQQLTGSFQLDVVNSDGSVFHTQTVTPTSTQFLMTVPQEGKLTFQIESQSTPQIEGDIGSVPGVMSQPGQQVDTSSPTAPNTINLTYEYSITGQAVDEHGQTVPGATMEIFLGNQSLGVVAADARGSYKVGLPAPGDYYLSQYPEAGEVGRRALVPVHSNGRFQLDVISGKPSPGGGGTGREALTDLAAYPVLTEEISTTGPPAPVTGGGPAAGGPGAGYGQTVEQVMRDVLGWRPSGDVAGFQAALNGAFELRQVEGHTEWSWQQRGYAVQADMGALTGAQASIYARAKSALDQVLPLLTGLTALNPALYPPQDLEAIRSVITAELKELVNELALEGGPRIQRVDELFRLLTGESRKSLNANPDVVQGQLGILRDRFGLTEAYVDTVDEERVVTNFRIVVEQALMLQESWDYDRKLLSVLDSNTSFGTILIWLSRGLEAVCESVDDLTFALDSVFVDAAQRQVIQLNFSNMPVELPELPLWRAKKHHYRFPPRQAPILLSDLLDWVTRASRDEGPKIVQDAGKDGVLAFAPILDELRRLIYATRKLAHGGQGVVLPDGMRTPRVRRALEVLAAQLDESANLATLVRRDVPPEITSATTQPVSPMKIIQPGAPMNITLMGTNFRRNCSVFLFAANREDMPDIRAQVTTSSASQVTATIRRVPKQHDAEGRRDWQVVLTNEDGSTSEPVAIQFP